MCPIKVSHDATTRIEFGMVMGAQNRRTTSLLISCRRQCDLLCNSWATPIRITSFHLNNRVDEFFRGSFRSRSASLLWRKIAPFCCLLGWDFGRVMLSAYAWTILSGSKLGFVFRERGGVRCAYPLPRRSAMRSLRICYTAGHPAATMSAANW